MKDDRMQQIGILVGNDDHRAQHDERALVRAAQADIAQFNALYHLYVERVHRYMVARTHSAEDAADLTQQVFLQALDALPCYRERGVPFGAWLFRIARNVVTDNNRRPQRTTAWNDVPPALNSSQAADPEATALHGEALTQLRALLVQLDPSKRELLALRFAAGLSSRQIADVIGKREAAVKKQLTRIINTLKEQYHAE
jgi:RNA polymerase sigma-70 factor (ECF subfamily)